MEILAFSSCVFLTTLVDEKSSPLAELSRLLIMGEGAHYVNRVRRLLFAIPPAKLADFLLSVDHYLFKSIMYYLQLFRRLPETSELINSPEFSAQALEKVVVYFQYNSAIQEIALEKIFTSHIPPLSQEKVLQLLLEIKSTARDHHLCLNIISLLDKEHLDIYIQQKPDAIKFLGEMITRYPQEMLRNILFQNPNLYGYLKLFFEYGDQANAGIIELLDKHESEMQEAIKATIMAKKLSDEKVELEYPAVDPRRVYRIIAELRDVENVASVLEILDNQGAFIHDTEKQIIRNVLVNPHFRFILDSMEMTEQEIKHFQKDESIIF